MLERSSNPATDDIVNRVVALLASGADKSYGASGTSMKSHMLLTADLAERAGAADTMIAAALLHDIGHFGVDYTRDTDDDAHQMMLRATVDRRHEVAGARWLSRYFPPSVTGPIRLHVAAKRYLASVESDYCERLAATTRHTLQLQGGPMSPVEVAQFEDQPYAEEAVILRRWDDASLSARSAIPDIEHYRSLLHAVRSRPKLLNGAT